MKKKEKKETSKLSLEDEIEMIFASLQLPFAGDNLSPEQKSMNAMCKIFEIARIYNKGWIPDFNNTDQYKYVPYLYKDANGRWVVNNNSVSYNSYWPVSLHYKSRELALKAINEFREIYNDYLMIQDA